ncbi:right-handed parallel beta-helix repeat-containing protein [Hymenobacter latericus]|uniref:hypothetical protein n=1 Tax=Hymenobacter sp. YIM 151858-1 TaxID=2987688 RepID=UPI002225D004|nr:hypothetical protein [Hymenobacter sp. YIM 151858-1]UYZ60131.1 hypothetical protein OIS50_04845 [Hymenobacter sp. YIM 151858-1]
MPNTVTVTATTTPASGVALEYQHPNTQQWQDSPVLTGVSTAAYAAGVFKVRLKNTPAFVKAWQQEVVVLDPRFTLGYYQGPLPKTYPPLPRRPKPTSWETGTQVISPSASGQTLVIENRNFHNNNAGQPALKVHANGLSNCTVIVRNCNFTGFAPSCLLEFWGLNASCTLDVYNCGFYGYQTPSGQAGYPGKGIDLLSSVAATTTLRNNYFENILGILVDRYGSQTNLLTIQGNYLHNVQKLDQNGNTDQYGNGIQLLQCFEVTADVRFNYIKNEPGQCSQQDGINLHGTSGRPTRRLRVQGNMQHGLYIHPSTSNSTGSSITTDNDLQSDAVGSKDPHYVDVIENYSAGATFGGFNLAGGYENRMERNVNVSTGRKPDGTANGSHSQGLSLYNYLNRPAAYYRDNVVKDNLLGVFATNGTSRNDFGQDAPGAQQLLFPSAFITQANQDRLYHFWRKDAEDAGVAVGLVSV